MDRAETFYCQRIFSLNIEQQKKKKKKEKGGVGWSGAQRETRQGICSISYF